MREIDRELLRKAIDALYSAPVEDVPVAEETIIALRDALDERYARGDGDALSSLAELNLWLKGERYCPACNGARWLEPDGRDCEPCDGRGVVPLEGAEQAP